MGAAKDGYLTVLMVVCWPPWKVTLVTSLRAEPVRCYAKVLEAQSRRHIHPHSWPCTPVHVLERVSALTERRTQRLVVLVPLRVSRQDRLAMT